MLLHYLTIWRPTILWKALFLYPRRHNILTRKNIENFELRINDVFLTSYVRYHASWNLIIFAAKQKHSGAKVSKLFLLIIKCKVHAPGSKYLFLIYSCLNPLALFRCCLAFRSQINLYLCCFCTWNSTPSPSNIYHRPIIIMPFPDSCNGSIPIWQCLTTQAPSTEHITLQAQVVFEPRTCQLQEFLISAYSTNWGSCSQSLSLEVWGEKFVLKEGWRHIASRQRDM